MHEKWLMSKKRKKLISKYIYHRIFLFLEFMPGILIKFANVFAQNLAKLPIVLIGLDESLSLVQFLIPLREIS